MPERPVWEPHHPHLGNLWASCNRFLSESVLAGEPALVSRWCRGQDAQGTLLQILAVLDSPIGALVVDALPTHRIERDEWHAPYWPTRPRWSAGPYRQVCYQFDGKTHPHKTNPPPTDLLRLLSPWLPTGYKFTQLGLPLSIADDVQLLAHSDAFLGVDSGISHIAHSAGIPCFLLEYEEPLRLAHPNKDYVPCYGANDAIQKVLRALP